MEIVVLLKQVPATESLIEVAADGLSIKTSGLKYVINPYDEIAVEEALQIQAAKGGTVTVVSVGPPKAAEAVRTALAMGADKGLLLDPGDLVLDGLGVAKVLAAAIRDLPYDLVIAGHRAVDGDNFQVGGAVAELLDIPALPMVVEAKLEESAIQCVCTVEGGTVEMRTSLPALLTTQRGLNEPRYASLPGIMKAKKKPLETKNVADLGLDAAALAPLVKLQALRLPPQRTGGRIIEGESAQAKAAELARLLHEEAKVI